VKLALLGADASAFGTSVLIALGCAMLRQCHLAGRIPPIPRASAASAARRAWPRRTPRSWLALPDGPHTWCGTCTPWPATCASSSPARVVRQLGDVVGRRDLLERRPGLAGKAAALDVAHLVSAPPARVSERRLLRQSQLHQPPARVREDEAAARAMAGEAVEVRQRLTNVDRAWASGPRVRSRDGSVTVDCRLAGCGSTIAGPPATSTPRTAVDGLEFDLRGVVADSCFTAAYGGLLVIAPDPTSRPAWPWPATPSRTARAAAARTLPARRATASASA